MAASDKALPTKRFSAGDGGFVCANCARTVLPLGRTARNHCPFCLCSLHVDILPGDRANPCGGVMDAVAAEVDARRGIVLLHRCRKCGQVTRNRAAYGPEFTVQPDDVDLLIALTARQE